MTCEYPNALSTYGEGAITRILREEHTNEPKLKLPHKDMHHLYHLMWDRYQSGEVTLKQLCVQVAPWFGRDWYPVQQCVYAHFQLWHGYAPKADLDENKLKPRRKENRVPLQKCKCRYPEGASDDVDTLVKKILHEPHDGQQVVKLARGDLHYLEHEIWKKRGIYGWGTLMRLSKQAAPWLGRTPDSVESSVVRHFKIHHEYAPNGVKYKPQRSRHERVVCSYPDAAVNASLIDQIMSGDVYDADVELTDDDMMVIMHLLWDAHDMELSGSLREQCEPIAPLIGVGLKSLLSTTTRHFVSCHDHKGVTPTRWTDRPQHDPKGVPCLWPDGDIDEVVIDRAIRTGGLEYKLLTVDERHAIVHIVRDKVTSDPYGQWCAKVAPNIGMTKDSLSAQITRHFKSKHFTEKTGK